MTSEKTAKLESILLAHKEKEKKSYLSWDQLRTKLGMAGRKKFGLTATATCPEVKNAVSPCLGENLMFFEKGDIAVLAFKMPTSDLQAEINSEKTVFLETALAKHKAKEKRSYIKSDKLRTSLGKTGRSMFGIGDKADGKEVQNALAPFLGDQLAFFWKKATTKAGKDTLYIAINIPKQEFIIEAIQALAPQKGFTLKKVTTDLPLDGSEFAALFNQQLESGRARILKINDKSEITSVQITPKDTSPAPLQSDRELFQTAFEKLDRGRIFVRICNMRRELGWSEERFDNLLRKLRSEGAVQLHAGDVATMTEEDVNLSYTDENNFFYATMTWKK